jgi:hypothetical protein
MPWATTQSAFGLGPVGAETLLQTVEKRLNMTQLVLELPHENLQPVGLDPVGGSRAHLQLLPHPCEAGTQLLLLDCEHLTEISGLLSVGDAGSLFTTSSDEFAHPRNVTPMPQGRTSGG